MAAVALHRSAMEWTLVQGAAAGVAGPEVNRAAEAEEVIVHTIEGEHF